MFSRLIRIEYFPLLIVAVVALASALGIPNKRLVPATLPVVVDPAGVVVVFKGDTLHDLARLLRPLSFTVSPGTEKAASLNLRDAIYVGAVDGRARLLTVWLPTNEDSSLLDPFNSNKPIGEVANALAVGRLASPLFAVIPVEVSWKDWQLNVVRSAAATVKGPESAASQLQEAISNSPTLLASIDTRNVSVPVGLEQTANVAMQPWFEGNRVVIQMRLTGNETISTALPDVTGLEAEGGLIVGEGFLNQIFANQHKDLLVGNEHGHAGNIQFSAQNEKLTIFGDYKEAPDPIKAKLAAVFEGTNLAFLRVSTQVNCGNAASLPCNAFKVELTTKMGLVALQRGKLLQPTEAQTLGNFNIGTKVLNGTSRFSRVQSANGALVLPGVFRLRGGSIL